MKEDRLTKSMLDMASGAIKERVDVEMPKIIKNILDVNTNPTKPRKLTLTFTPDDMRQVVTTKCEVKTALVASNPVTTSLYVGEFNGEVQAVEMQPQVPGQMGMDGSVQEEPAQLKLVESI